jgi:hypothetical protein
LINFRYHIVSLMAVFLALAVGITLGVTLVGDEANEALAAQAAQDRRLVQEYRRQLEQQRALDDYRAAYEEEVGEYATSGLLTGSSVAVIAMPDAPPATVNAITDAVETAGGTVTATATVSAEVFDPNAAADVQQTLGQFGDHYDPDATVADNFGAVLGRGLLAPRAEPLDETAVRITDELAGTLIRLDQDSEQAAQLAVVVGAQATDPPLGANSLVGHVEFDLALNRRATGVVVAGPNSTAIDGTDVAAVRSQTDARDLLSSVDAADLPSGVSTVVMAGREQLLDGQGHYGYANSADAPAPELPIR